MAYATRTDLPTFGIPTSALAPISTTVQDGALSGASEVVDSYLRPRGKLPLTAWGDDIRRAVCIIAAYDLLVTRGYNPQAGSDINIRARYDDIIKWLVGVSEGIVHPNVTFTPDDGLYDQPIVVSKRAPRGW